MLVMPSLSSMAMNGKDATSKFARTGLLALLVDLVVAEALVAVVASAVAMEVAEALADVVASVEASADVEVTVVAAAATAVLLAAALDSTRMPAPTHLTHSPTSLLLEASPATPSTFATCHGPRAMRTLSSSSPRLERSSVPRYSMSPTDGLAEPVLWSSRRMLTRRLQLVSTIVCYMHEAATNKLLAKFTGYQYGGRPLGLTYVKYTNQSNGTGDAMEGAEMTGGMTQDQIM